MRTMKSAVLAALTAGALLVGTVSAQSFAEEDVEGFIAVIEGASEIHDEHPDADVELPASLEGGMGDLGALLDDEGDFRVFRLMTEAMAAKPDEPAVRDFNDLVTGSGFDGLTEFGGKADAILMAYMALQLEAEGADLDGMTPEMMSMMPPGLRAQMEPILRMMDAVKNVPDADRKALRPYRSRLEAAMEG